MDRLNIPPSNSSQYPLSNENLQILNSYGETVTKLLAGLNLPNNTCVFIDNVTNKGLVGQKFFVYVKDSAGNSYTLNLDMGSYSYSDVFESTNPQLQVVKTETPVSVSNSLGTFNGVRTIVTGTLQPVVTKFSGQTQTTPLIGQTPSVGISVWNKVALYTYTFLTLSEAMKVVTQRQSQRVDLAQCPVYVGHNLGLDAQGNITNATQLSSQPPMFNSNSYIDKIGDFLKINISLPSLLGLLQLCANAGNNAVNVVDYPKLIIELPIGFVNFTRATQIKRTIDIVNNNIIWGVIPVQNPIDSMLCINAAVDNNSVPSDSFVFSSSAIIYGRYIFVFGIVEWAFTQSIVDYIPIV